MMILTINLASNEYNYIIKFVEMYMCKYLKNDTSHV